ncbi:MAG: response regulator [Pirellulales bacterium]|nr:response regulator [Pirellulales bacterium]
MTKTLLIVDDALIIREIVKETAIAAGWEIAGEAINGQEAIDLYLKLKPSAVTLDMVMPEYDGIHALRGIMEADPEAKILVLSALDQKTVLQQAFKLGASDFIVKPFNKGRLVESLECLVLEGENIPTTETNTIA